MSQQQPIRVVVEKKSGGASGCGTAFAVLLLVALAVKYWYIALGILVLAVAVGMIVSSRRHKQVRRSPGPRDPWLNEVVVALDDLGLTERARNTGGQLGGAPLEGDVGLEADRFLVFVNLFASDELARQAEMGLRVTPNIRTAISEGHTAVKALGRVVYVASGRGGVVDDFRLDEVIRAVSPISVPPILQTAPMSATSVGASVRPVASAAQFGATSPDALEQLRKLADRHDGGVLTDAEFEAKKGELLRRI